LEGGKHKENISQEERRRFELQVINLEWGGGEKGKRGFGERGNLGARGKEKNRKGKKKKNEKASE